MARFLSTPGTGLPRRSAAALLLAGLLLAFALLARDRLAAQVEGERGIAPIAASSDIEVFGVQVNVKAKNAEEARKEAWELAMRKAWEKIDGPTIPDGQLQSMVSAVVIENEQIGPRRYIATLGIIFDRKRAGTLLGADGPRGRSAPMVLIPVLYSAGTATVYETRNPWQRAWAEYQAGSSAIDYVRPSGAGGESLLVTFGQVGRRSRTWWRTVLDEFAAADVLIAIARIERQWPGGPVEGHFTARYGPDNNYLESFSMKAASEQELPAMLNKALLRFDRIFTQALKDSKLKPDPTLDFERMELDPGLQALLRASRQSAIAVESPIAGPVEAITSPTQSVGNFNVQFASPDASSVDSVLGAVRATAGVQGASTRSIALGGTSVMTVSYAGSLEGLADALRARGFQVVVGTNALSIRR